MVAIAPNLTILVGELVGARLISHAGSLLNLAKHPASTVQILGAEKALFKALKTKHDTPKYGLIYHAQVVGQASTKLKGKASRMLAAKAALACRVDALSEEATSDIGYEQRAKVEARIRQLEGGHAYKVSGTGRQSAKFDKYENKSEIVEYKTAADSTIKRKADSDETVTPKKIKVEEDVEETKSEKKKKKKQKQDSAAEEVEVKMEVEEATSEKKKKKKKEKQEEDEEVVTPVKKVKEEPGDGSSKKKKVKVEEDVDADEEEKSAKKKKKKKQEEEEAAAPAAENGSSKKKKKKKDE